MDLVCKDVELRGLKKMYPLFPQKPLSPQNGKGNGFLKNPKPKVGLENRAPNTTKANTTKVEVEKQTPPNQLPVKRSPKELVSQKQSPKELVSQKPSRKEPVSQKPSPKEPVPQE